MGNTHLPASAGYNDLAGNKLQCNKVMIAEQFVSGFCISLWETIILNICYYKKSVLSSEFSALYFSKCLSSFKFPQSHPHSLWFSDCGCSYCHSGRVFKSGTLPEWFSTLKDMVFNAAGLDAVPFTACNITMYSDGSQSLGWHADDEDIFGDPRKNVPIVSLSLGQQRDFLIKCNTSGAIIDVPLAPGDVLLMMGPMQNLYKHCVPKSDCSGPRINITWRAITRHNCY